MSKRLDKDKDYATICGKMDNGARYEQDGQYFRGDGSHIGPVKGMSAPKSAQTVTPPTNDAPPPSEEPKGDGADTGENNAPQEGADNSAGNEGENKPISKMNKDDLEAYALEKHGVDLDKRKGVKALRTQVAELDAKAAE